MPRIRVFSTVKAKEEGAEGGGMWLHSFLTLTIYGSGQNHTWSFYAWLNSPHYPLNARLGGPRIWNERFTEKNKSVAPLQGPTQNSSDVQHTAYWLNRLFCIALFRIPPIIFILTEINRRHFFRSSPKKINRELKYLTVLSKSRIKILRELKNLTKLSRSRTKMSRE
jgi:hypothetical protein